MRIGEGECANEDKGELRVRMRVEVRGMNLKLWAFFLGLDPV